jgi:hypothetical protein
VTNLLSTLTSTTDALHTATPRCSAAAAVLASLSLGCTAIAKPTVYPLPKKNDPEIRRNKKIIKIYKKKLKDKNHI